MLTNSLFSRTKFHCEVWVQNAEDSVETCFVIKLFLYYIQHIYTIWHAVMTCYDSVKVSFRPHNYHKAWQAAYVCVCVCVCWLKAWDLLKRLNRSKYSLGCRLLDSKEPCIRCGPASPWERALWGIRRSVHSRYSLLYCQGGSSDAASSYQPTVTTRGISAWLHLCANNHRFV